MGPQYIFLDTNNWIYLANGFNVLSKEHDDLHFRVFDIIEKRVDDGSLTFLVNDVILEEFERNKAYTEEKIKKIQNKATSYVGHLKAIKEFTPEAAAEIEKLQQQVEETSAKKIAIQKEHIARVENFLKTKTKRIAITAENKIAAAEMALAKKAPFIGDKKNSMADALILLSSIAYIEKHGKTGYFSFGEDEPEDTGYYQESYFVSSNSGDFSHPEHKEHVHPDLEQLLAKPNIRFYHNLGPLITALDKEFLTLEEEAQIEAADEAFICPVCEYEYSGLNFETIKIFDPHKLSKDSNDPAQIDLFDGQLIEVNDPIVETKTAFCDSCGADFIECPHCEELVHIPNANIVTECTGCHYQFILHEEKDKKGSIVHHEFEIVNYEQCIDCGNAVEYLTTDGLCETCAEYRLIAESD